MAPRLCINFRGRHILLSIACLLGKKRRIYAYSEREFGARRYAKVQIIFAQPILYFGIFLCICAIVYFFGYWYFMYKAGAIVFIERYLT